MALSRFNGIIGDCNCDCDGEPVVNCLLSPIVASLPFLGIAFLNAAMDIVRPPGGNDDVDEALDMNGADRGDCSGDPRLEGNGDLEDIWGEGGELGKLKREAVGDGNESSGACVSYEAGKV